MYLYKDRVQVLQFIDNHKSNMHKINCVVFPDGKVAEPLINNIKLIKEFARENHIDLSECETEQDMVNVTNCVSFHRNEVLEPESINFLQQAALYDLRSSYLVYTNS